jgi:hypothetical protein
VKFEHLTKALVIAGVLAAVATSAAAARQDPATVSPSGAADTSGEAVTLKECPGGFYRVGATLCMTGAMGPDSFANAMAVCQYYGAAVANYGAWRYRILYGDGVAAPQEWWLGPITADDRALYVNSTNVGNFDGETSRFDSRYYACSKG